MKRILLLIPLVLSGCSQDREERRDTVTNWLKNYWDSSRVDDSDVKYQLAKQNRQAGITPY